MVNLKNAELPTKIAYLLAVAGSLLLLFGFADFSIVDHYYLFIAEIVAAFLALTIAVIAFNLSAQHRNRFTPYLGLAFLCVGIIDLLNALFAKGILVNPDFSVATFTKVSHLISHTMLSFLLAIGWFRTVKRPGIWKIAPYYTVGVITLSITIMLLLTHIRLQDDELGSTHPLYQLFTVLPVFGYVLTIVFIFKFKHWPKSNREFVTGNALVPCLIVLILSLLLLSLPPVADTNSLLLSYYLKILAYLLAMITMVSTLWRYAEYSFQIAGTKVSTIFCMMLFMLSFLSLLEFDRHEREIMSGNDQVLVELLIDQHNLDKIEYDMSNLPSPVNEQYLYKLGSLWQLQRELSNFFENTADSRDATAIREGFKVLLSSVKQLFYYTGSHGVIDNSEITQIFLPAIQQFRKLLADIVDKHYGELTDTKNQKIAAIHNQLIYQLSLLALLIVCVIAVNRWHNYKLLQPVISLYDTTQRVTNNQENISIISGRNDELGRLEKSFNTMVDHLRSSLSDLEKRVEQRTEELSKKEQQLRNIMDNVEKGIITTNQIGIIETINPAVCDMFGYTEQELTGSPISVLTSEREHGFQIITNTDDGDLNKNNLKRSHQRKEIGLRSNGSTFPIKISVKEIIKGSKRTFIVVISDITEEIKTEQVLKDSEQRMGRFFGASLEGLLFHEHGKIVDSNIAAAKLLGHKVSDLIGKNISDFFSKDHHDLLQTAPDSHKQEFWESIITRPDGSSVPVNVHILDINIDGQMLSIAVIRDITERKQAEEKLHQAREKLQLSLNLLKSIVESIPIRVFWKDRFLRYLGCNSLFSTDAGFIHPEKLIGKTDMELPWKNLAECFKKQDQYVLETANPLLSYEESRISPDGNTLWLRTSKVPLTNDDGDIIGVLGVSDDVTQQKLAEQTLLLSENRLKVAQEVAHLGSWELDLKNNVLWWSDENYRIFGMKKSDRNITFETFLQIVHPDDMEMVNKVFNESVNNRTPYNIEHRLLMQDGSVKWVHEQCKTDYDNDDKPLRSIGTTMDITIRKQSQITLDKHNQFTNSILEIIGSLVFVLDTEGRIVRFNRACEELTGHLYENIKGDYIWNIVPELIDRENFKRLYQKPRKEDFPNRRRISWPTIGGEIRTIDWENFAFTGENNRLEYVIAAGIDVTDRLSVEKILEDQLRSLERKVEGRTRELDTMFTLSPDGFVMIDNKHQVIFANPAFLEMTGMKLDYVVGVSMLEFCQRVFELCDISEEFQLVADDFFRKNPILNLNRPTDRVLSCIEKTMYDPNISMNGLVLYFRDITHETEVDRIKSEFLSTAAHEFRTPLSSILGFSELLLSRNYNEEERKRFTNIIHRQSKHLKNLLDELLDLARIDARAGRDFYILVDNPKHVIEQVIEDTRSLAIEKHKLKLEFMEKWPLVAFDIDKLSQVLANILSNAYKYSPQGGTITCSTTLKTIGNQQMFGIKIEDQGIGMTPEELIRIGERFYRADPTGTIPGTGLGVSLVKEIIEIHKGEVDITSRMGKGTVVTVWLPVVKGKPQSAARAV